MLLVWVLRVPISPTGNSRLFKGREPGLAAACLHSTRRYRWPSGPTSLLCIRVLQLVVETLLLLRLLCLFSFLWHQGSRW